MKKLKQWIKTAVKMGFINIEKYIKNKLNFLNKFYDNLEVAVKKETEFGNDEFPKIVKERKKSATGKWEKTKPVSLQKLSKDKSIIDIKNIDDARNVGVRPGTYPRLSSWGIARGFNPDYTEDFISLTRIARSIHEIGTPASNYITINKKFIKIADLPIYEETLKRVGKAKEITRQLNEFFKD